MSLVIAARKGDLDRVKAAVIRGEDIDGRGSHGNTALHEACKRGHVDIVKYLLANRANTELGASFRKWTALQLACVNGHAAVVQALHYHGVELNQTVDKKVIRKEETPLQLACRYGHAPTVQALLDYGVDLNQTFNEPAIRLRVTPFHIACTLFKSEVMEILLDHALDNGYVTKVLQLCERDQAIAHNYHVRNKMGLNQIAKAGSSSVDMYEHGESCSKGSSHEAGSSSMDICWTHGESSSSGTSHEVPDQFTSSHRKQYKDHSSAKRNFVRRIIDKALRKTPIQRDRSQVENEQSKSIGSRTDVEEKKPSYELSGKMKKRACESETMLQDDEINSFSDVYPEEDIHERGEPSTRRTSAEAGSERQNGEDVSIEDLDALVMLELCEQLDRKQSSDYRYLAAHFGMAKGQIARISQGEDKTEEVLNWIGRNSGNTVAKLREILRDKMRRHDCVAVINKKYY